MKEGIGCIIILIIFALMALVMWENPDGDTNVTITGEYCSNCDYKLSGGD